MRRVISSYRFAPALLARSLGAVLVLAGALVAVAAVGVTLGLPGAVMSGAFLAGAVLVVLGGVATALLWRCPLVRFDEHGYQVRLLRGAGVRRSRWRDVKDAVTATAGGEDCVVLRLRDGRTTSVPVRVLDADPASFVADLRTHLDRGHGLRRLT